MTLQIRGEWRRELGKALHPVATPGGPPAWITQPSITPSAPTKQTRVLSMKQVTGLPERMETELDRFPWTQIITQWEAGSQRPAQEVKVWSGEKRTLAPGHGSGRGDSWVGPVFHSKPSGP